MWQSKRRREWGCWEVVEEKEDEKSRGVVVYKKKRGNVRCGGEKVRGGGGGKGVGEGRRGYRKSVYLIEGRRNGNIYYIYYIY